MRPNGEDRGLGVWSEILQLARNRCRRTFYECGDLGRTRSLQDGPSVLISNCVVDLGLSKQKQDWNQLCFSLGLPASVRPLSAAVWSAVILVPSEIGALILMLGNARMDWMMGTTVRWFSGVDSRVPTLTAMPSRAPV